MTNARGGYDNETLNEDWLKPGTWDVRNPDGSEVTTADDLLSQLDLATGATDVERLRAVTRLPAWEAAPPELRASVDDYLTGPPTP